MNAGILTSCGGDRALVHIDAERPKAALRQKHRVSSSAHCQIKRLQVRLKADTTKPFDPLINERRS